MNGPPAGPGDSSVAPLAVTMGEPAGISGEILLKSWRRRQQDSLHPFYAIDNVARLESLAKLLGLTVPIQRIEKASDAVACFDAALPVLPLELPARAVPGQPNPTNAGTVIESIDRAVAATQEGDAAAIVTSPIHKATLVRTGFQYPGHTEYLAALAGSHATVMMLVSQDLRVVPVTSHVSLQKAIETLSTDAIVRAARICHDALVSCFGIAHPRLAVAALNPHAGEETLLGEEERTIIQPAVNALDHDGLDVRGPVPADSLFHEAARRTYDAAICMYHDQALIPLKTIDFAGGVNVTLGLPFVRTSPDHGTAFDIAGTGAADEGSMVAALKLAALMASRRTKTLDLPVSAHG